MYTEYFGLAEKPFAITPDPRYLFLSGRHEEALAHLVYGVQEGGGFVQLTGEVGTGKTTLIKALLERLPANVDVAFIFNPRMTAFEFLAAACDEFRVAYTSGEATVKTLIDALNRKLLDAHAQGRRVVLIVDEAQNFAIDVLEQIRLLTNLETTKLKLLQIILVGQPELRELLGRRDLRQLAQRVTARYHLVPMTRDEVAAYIEHRLAVAGVDRPLFTRGALSQVWKHSGGVPRLINVICDRALLGAYASEATQVDSVIVNKAVREVLGGQVRPSRWMLPRYAVPAMAGSTAVAVLAAVLAWSGVASRYGSSMVAEPTHQMATTASASPVVTNAAAKSDVSDATVAALSAKRIASAAEWRSTLLGKSETADIESSFRGLFGLWRVRYERMIGSDGCEKAISARLQCHWDRGSADDFIAFNHPGITWITDSNGVRRYALIRGVRSGAATMQVGDALLEIPIAVLREAWEGQYVMLWQPPALDTKLLQPGARGDVVVWLRRTLDREQGIAPVASSADQYDPALVERVKAFQRQQRLTPDGLVGEQTFLHLNAIGGAARMPVLSADAAAGE